MHIYLAGSVPKGEQEARKFVDWRAQYKKVLARLLPDAHCIDPYTRTIDESDFEAVFGSDSKHIKECDLVIVNAEKKLGAGTAMELPIAKYFGKPVITVIPKDTHHRRTNLEFNGSLIADWIHPFIYTFSDVCIESIEHITKEHIAKAQKSPKTITVIDDAIAHFESL